MTWYLVHMASTIADVTADELRAWMREHGYTVRGLAAATRVAPATVQRYRDGSQAVPYVFELALRGLEADSGGTDED